MDKADHACPPGHLYVCPTAREVESSCHGGFATCCDRPDLHVPIPDGPGAEALSVALSEAAKREHLLQQGAIERSAMLEECRDLLESAGHNGAHGDDWPEVAPALRALIADRDALRKESAGAAAGREQIRAISRDRRKQVDDLHHPVKHLGADWCAECSVQRSTGPRESEWVALRPWPCLTYEAVRD